MMQTCGFCQKEVGEKTTDLLDHMAFNCEFINAKHAMKNVELFIKQHPIGILGRLNFFNLWRVFISVLTTAFLIAVWVLCFKHFADNHSNWIVIPISLLAGLACGEIGVCVWRSYDRYASL